MMLASVVLSEEILEVLLYVVILLFGGEKALQAMRRGKNGGSSMADGKVVAVRLSALEEVIKKMDVESVKIEVATLRAVLESFEKSVKSSINDLWNQVERLRKVE